MSVIGDLLSVVNSDINKTLDVLITEKTNIKIQTKTLYFSDRGSNAYNVTENIDEVDVSKSIIVPISYVNDNTTSSISVNFINNNQIQAQRTNATGLAPNPVNYTVLIITFGANVNNS